MLGTSALVFYLMQQQTVDTPRVKESSIGWKHDTSFNISTINPTVEVEAQEGNNKQMAREPDKAEKPETTQGSVMTIAQPRKSSKNTLVSLTPKKR